MLQALWPRPHTKLSTEKAKGKLLLQIEKVKGCPRRAAFFCACGFCAEKSKKLHDFRTAALKRQSIQEQRAENGKSQKFSSDFPDALRRCPDEPDEEVACEDCGEREGNADLHEVGEADFVAFLAEHADAGDVRGDADGR